MTQNKYKSKNYFIIKIRCHASDYYLDKFHKNEDIGIKKQWEAANKNTEFYWKFVECVTKKQDKWFYKMYGFGGKECAEEEMLEQYGILICSSRNYNYFHIPKQMTDISDWMIENLTDIPYKILQKTTFLQEHLLQPTTWQRESSILNTKKILEKLC